MQRVDAIVIGAGGMGSAALMHLAARGARVCGLDRFPLAHDRGSSHGHTRLIRLAYFEHPDYVPLLRRAYELWHALESTAGRPLLVESGLLLAGPAEGEVVSGTLAAARIHSLQVEQMTAGEAIRRWPAFQLPADWTAVYEPRGGYLFVEECVRAHAAAAVRAGARIDHGVAVHGWREEGRTIVVQTDRGPYATEKLVVTAGPWAADLLQLPELHLHLLRKPLFWYEPRDTTSTAFAAGHLPCFGFDGPTGFFYGFPSVDARGVKIAEHTGGTSVTDPLQLDRGIDPEEQRRVEAVLADRLPGVGLHCSAHAACMYTMSPDGHFVVGLHPRHANVAIAAGFSGHGFKFASVMGEILADLALDGQTARPIGFLSPLR